MYNVLKMITYALVLIGALNWGLIGIFNFDLVQFLLGDMTIATRIVYSLVGISAVAFAIMDLRCHSHEANFCEACNH